MRVCVCMCVYVCIKTCSLHPIKLPLDICSTKSILYGSTQCSKDIRHRNNSFLIHCVLRLTIQINEGKCIVCMALRVNWQFKKCFITIMWTDSDNEINSVRTMSNSW